jgi:hypothetical protein
MTHPSPRLSPETGNGNTFAGVDRQLELDRLCRIEAIFDPASRRLLETSNLPTAAHCLEIGAGAGSVAA